MLVQSRGNIHFRQLRDGNNCPGAVVDADGIFRTHRSAGRQARARKPVTRPLTRTAPSLDPRRRASMVSGSDAGFFERHDKTCGQNVVLITLDDQRSIPRGQIV